METGILGSDLKSAPLKQLSVCSKKLSNSYAIADEKEKSILSWYFDFKDHLGVNIPWERSVIGADGQRKNDSQTEQ